MKKQFMVIGLGRFGSSLTRTLIENGHEVLALDTNENVVQEMASIATQVIHADSTDETVLKQLGASNFHHGIVAIGDDLQASIMTTLILKELNMPKVTAKARNDMHGTVLYKVGADHVVYPERDMGIRLGKQLSSDTLIDYIELSPNYNLVEILAPHAMNGRTLDELNIRAEFGCTILAIKTNDEINISPKAEDRVHAGDLLLMIGSNEDIRQLENHYERKR
ncbi:potassium channel family protein [Paenibacillus senegalensis]|uniref:potassium channel family protein n=1 Tax=Paenibacillus senegalensis TaxID=1465766 RepID=UPI00028A0F8A|nr:TrkA family potassium uptake protein [Paenibacillus senegalensis]